MEAQDIFVAHPRTEEEVSALKAIMKALKINFEISKEPAYDPNFVAKILESRQQVKEGKTVQVALDDIRRHCLPPEIQTAQYPEEASSTDRVDSTKSF